MGITKKLKKTFMRVMEKGEPVSVAMVKSGYKEITAKKPKNATGTKGWQQLMDSQLPDKLLAKVHREGLKAVDTNSLIVGYEPSAVKGGKSIPIVKIVHAPDHTVRHKFLDTAYKIKGKYSETSIGVAVQINVNSDKEQFA